MEEGNIVKVNITGAGISLDKFLKWSNIVQSGGEAKYLIQKGKVKVNGKQENRRSRKLLSQDRVEVEGLGTFQVDID